MKGYSYFKSFPIILAMTVVIVMISAFSYRFDIISSNILFRFFANEVPPKWISRSFFNKSALDIHLKIGDPSDAEMKVKFFEMWKKPDASGWTLEIHYAEPCQQGHELECKASSAVIMKIFQDRTIIYHILF